MRARYVAYAIGNIEFILSTTHPDGSAWRDDEAEWREDVRAFCEQTTFRGLRILDAPRPIGDEGFVTFRARLRQADQPADFTERSRFVRERERWLYHSGERTRD